MMISAMSEILFSGLQESNYLGISIYRLCLSLALIIEHEKAHGLPWPRPYYHLEVDGGARKKAIEKKTPVANACDAIPFNVTIDQTLASSLLSSIFREMKWRWLCLLHI
jgi:hypothetical protein